MSTGPTFGKKADVRKRTTKVNLTLVIAVVVFFILGVFGIYWLWQNTSA
jgi:hypothetical protein